jgi:hypothetical protein
MERWHLSTGSTCSAPNVLNKFTEVWYWDGEKEARGLCKMLSEKFEVNRHNT